MAKDPQAPSQRLLTTATVSNPRPAFRAALSKLKRPRSRLRARGAVYGVWVVVSRKWSGSQQAPRPPMTTKNVRMMIQRSRPIDQFRAYSMSISTIRA